MAWFKFACPTHGQFTVSLEKREVSRNCPKCGVESDGVIGIGTTQVMERLDNGLMGRAVERLHNIEEILDERADKDQLPQPFEDDDE